MRIIKSFYVLVLLGYILPVVSLTFSTSANNQQAVIVPIKLVIAPSAALQPATIVVVRAM